MQNSNVPTSSITFVETDHGRQRRLQRGIDKKDLQRAKKYGKRTFNRWSSNGDPTAKYTYKYITYIVNEVTGEEVTCYPTPIKLDYVPVNTAMQTYHDEAVSKIQNDLGYWTSNTVIVIDTSGSMKKADVWGARTRLGNVWVSVALDFLAHRIETGNACGTDVISVITLSTNPEMVINEEPCTWTLYNKISKIYNKGLIEPRSDGPFLPCLDIAERLLRRNPSASCAMGLTLLSDGKPSDRHCTKEEVEERIVKKVENLAKDFGRRFTFAAIGIGDEEDFHILEKMAEGARDYLANGIFQLPSMSSSAIGQVFSSVATSVTSTQSEMTDLNTLKQRQVRQVQRVSLKKVQQQLSMVSPSDFYIYPRHKVIRTVYKEWYEDRRRKSSFEETGLQNPRAKFVAFEKGPFGEGAERLAYRFYELREDGRAIVGAPLVAKENRLILEDDANNEHSRKKFVYLFCSTQQLARRLGQEFNKKLDSLRRVDIKTPRVGFLDCSVYQLEDMKLGKISVLVEERLDETRWHKWNANNGYVEGMKGAPTFHDASLRECFQKIDIDDLGIIEEDEDDEEEEDNELEAYKSARNQIQPKLFTASEVAQAFSHFTYLASGKKRLVCDLQGVYDEKENVLKFSDPVIHYHDARMEERRAVHGQTDRGKKGMYMFFQTHKEHCGHLCRLMTRGFRDGFIANKQRVSNPVQSQAGESFSRRQWLDKRFQV